MDGLRMANRGFVDVMQTEKKTKNWDRKKLSQLPQKGRLLRKDNLIIKDK